MVKCKPQLVPKQQATSAYEEWYKCPSVRNKDVQYEGLVQTQN
jgi:hypothetical protein